MAGRSFLLGLGIAASGLAIALSAERSVRRIERRKAEGDDAYFEEQRALTTYPWLGNAKVIRRWGWFIAVGGVALTVAALFVPD
ncbi:hypothetical protein [Sphingomonas sp.]|uniref:hypothetical protein n=1 Tax=Sphingomonas sp. TaxID=28214 RepID=UPI001B199C1C|nr:hypothetical protein [Sphingomonas sp.]MBO9714888.1 hypothetical protein [Sphingomonas sp.]